VIHKLLAATDRQMCRQRPRTATCWDCNDLSWSHQVDCESRISCSTGSLPPIRQLSDKRTDGWL